MKLRVFKLWGKSLRESPDSWMLVHSHGEYQYRNPDSVYIHRHETFRSREDALDYLDTRIPKVEQSEWALYRREVVAA